MADIEGQRGEQWVDPQLVELRYPCLLIRSQVVDPVYHDACAREGLLQAVPAAGVLVDETAHLGGDLLHQEVVVDGCVVRAGDWILGDYPRHAYHVEFVQIAVADGEELDPLQQRVRSILRLLEAAPVELEPRELAVDVVLRIVQIGGAVLPLAGLATAGRHQKSSSAFLTLTESR